MKTYMKYSKLFFILLLSFITMACSNTPKEEAKSENEEKFFSDSRLEEDADFLVEYASFLNYSLALSDIAMEKSVQEEVKMLAKEVRGDHYTIKNELASLAGDFQISLPSEISMEKKAEIKAMDALPPTAFEVEYLSKIINMHEAWESQLKEVIDNTKVEMILDFARKINDHQFRHLEKAEKALENLQVNS